MHLVHGHQKASLYIEHRVGSFNTLTYTHVTQRKGTGQRIGSHLFLRYIFTECRRNRIQTWTEIQNISLNPGRPVGYRSGVYRLVFQFGTRDEDWKTYSHWVTCAIPMWRGRGGGGLSLSYTKYRTAKLGFAPCALLAVMSGTPEAPSIRQCISRCSQALVNAITIFWMLHNFRKNGFLFSLTIICRRDHSESASFPEVKVKMKWLMIQTCFLFFLSLLTLFFYVLLLCMNSLHRHTHTHTSNITVLCKCHKTT